MEKSISSDIRVICKAFPLRKNECKIYLMSLFWFDEQKVHFLSAKNCSKERKNWMCELGLDLSYSFTFVTAGSARVQDKSLFSHSCNGIVFVHVFFFTHLPKSDVIYSILTILYTFTCASHQHKQLFFRVKQIWCQYVHKVWDSLQNIAKYSHQKLAKLLSLLL